MNVQHRPGAGAGRWGSPGSRRQWDPPRAGAGAGAAVRQAAL